MIAVKKNATTASAVLLTTMAWFLMALTPRLGSFEVMQYIGSSYAAAYAWATTLVNYLNSWWGFAAAVAFAAAMGLSWTVVLIKAVLQKVGLKFAIQYATML